MGIPLDFVVCGTFGVSQVCAADFQELKEEFTLKIQSLGFKNQVISKLSIRFRDPSWLWRVWHCSTSLYLGSWDHPGQSTGHHHTDSLTHGAPGPLALRLPVLLATAHSFVYRPLALSSTFGRVHASWVDDSATQRSSQGYTFSLGSGSVSLWSTRLSSILSSSFEAEIYAGAMAAQDLCWLTYLLFDLGELPRSPPVLYVDNKAMIALCQEHKLEHRTKHITLQYFLARELQQHGQLRLAYEATRANTADIFTKALPPGDHQRFSTVLGLMSTLPHLLTA
ncbi:unnamed protein product [Closterium sp. NIES-53]